MPGHIRKRGKNSWAVIVDLGNDPVTGKRRQLWRSVKGNKREAETLLVQLLHQRDTGIDQPSGKLAVGEYLERWLHDYAQPNTAPKTYRCYEDVVRRHLVPALGSIALSKLSPQHIQAYYSRALQKDRLDGQGGLSARSVLRHAHATLMLQQGTHPKVVSERLDHSAVGTTLDIYSHVLPGIQAQAAAQLDELVNGVTSEIR